MNQNIIFRKKDVLISNIFQPILTKITVIKIGRVGQAGDPSVYLCKCAYKTFVQREEADVKEFSRIAANTARTFENTSSCQIIHQCKDKKSTSANARDHFFCIIIPQDYKQDSASTVYSFSPPRLTRLYCNKWLLNKSSRAELN